MIWSIFCNFDIHLGSNFLELVSLENYQMGRAICNDGTPAVYYRNPLNGASDSKKLLIFLQGGGMCVPNLHGTADLLNILPNVYFQDTSVNQDAKTTTICAQQPPSPTMTLSSQAIIITSLVLILQSILHSMIIIMVVMSHVN